jgi:uncharacterized protein (DUF1800 family)
MRARSALMVACLSMLYPASGSAQATAMGSTAAARLLMLGTFGASLNDIQAASTQTFATWFANQAAQPASLELPSVTTSNGDRKPIWWKNAVAGPDQLRQRIAFALSEIFVVSNNNSILVDRAQSRASYYDLLAKDAFVNFRTLIDDVSHSPVMGNYLSFFRNDKPNPVTGSHADENYAREVMQLFTVGLWQLNADGSRQLDSNGNGIPTYVQADVTNLARVFTGWASKPVTHTGDAAWTYDEDLLDPMVAYEDHHDTNAKVILGGVQIPGGGTSAADMKIALDTLFNHPNVGPFIGRQLIQRLVTSNPSPDYVARISAVFANNGQGVRGDMLAVVTAILTDAAAQTVGYNGDQGKLREPILRVTNLWRAFTAHDSAGNVAEQQVVELGIANFDQNSLESPTVFNFFRPDYERAGPLASAGLATPEFQIANENTVILTSNELQTISYQYVDSTGKVYSGTDGYFAHPSSTTVFLQTAAWEPLAADAGMLADNLNLVFMAGQMPAAMRATLVNYINQVPASPAATRVAEATSLLINSPQYAIQR